MIEYDLKFGLNEVIGILDFLLICLYFDYRRFGLIIIILEYLIEFGYEEFIDHLAYVMHFSNLPNLH